MEDKQFKRKSYKEQIPPEKREVVLPDECGDSLWDKVLQPNNKYIYPAGTSKQEGVLNNIINEQDDKREDKTPIPGKNVLN